MIARLAGQAMIRSATCSLPCPISSAPSPYARCCFGQPALVQHLLRNTAVQMRPDKCLKRLRDLLIFVVAILGSLLRQVTLRDEVAERFRIGAVREAQQVVHALSGCAVLVRKLLELRRRSGAFYLDLVGIGGA